MGFKGSKWLTKVIKRVGLIWINKLNNNGLNHMKAYKYDKHWTYKMKQNIDYNHREVNTQE